MSEEIQLIFPTPLLHNSRIGVKFGDRPVLEKHFSLWLSLDYKSGWLCGTTALADLTVSIVVAATGPWPEKPDIPEEYVTRIYEVTAGTTNAWEYYRNPGWYVIWDDKILEKLQSRLYRHREEVFAKSFDWIVKTLSAKTNGIILGGRVTSHPGDEDTRDRHIRTPELVEYIIKNKMGVISATHIHNNVNYQNTEGSKVMSGQQYWLWTYQDPEDTKLPQVVSADPELCGVFYGKYESAEQLRNIFLDRWSTHFAVSRDHKSLHPRYSLKKTEETGTNHDLTCQKTIPAVVEEVTAVAAPPGLPEQPWQQEYQEVAAAVIPVATLQSGQVL